MRRRAPSAANVQDGKGATAWKRRRGDASAGPSGIAGSVDGLTWASGPRAHRGPVPRPGARRAGRLPRDRRIRRRDFCFWRANGASRRAGGGGGTESDERRARARTRRGGRRACSMRRGGRARTLEAGDASGVVARTGTRSRTRSSEEEKKGEAHEKHLRFFLIILVCLVSLKKAVHIEQKISARPPASCSWQSRLRDPDASGLGTPRVTSGAARQGDTGVPRRGTAHAKRFAWPPPARARRETHSGSSRLADG